MQKPASGWERAELETLDAMNMDVERITSLVANINNSLHNIHNPRDSKKLREIQAFFEKELYKRNNQQLEKTA